MTVSASRGTADTSQGPDPGPHLPERLSGGPIPPQRIQPAPTGSAGPTAAGLLRSYRRQAVIADLCAAVLACSAAYAVRFGGDGARHPAVFFSIPPVWLLCLGVHRGYETRFLGDGADEYRRVANSGLLLFTVIAVVSFSFRDELARGFVLLAVPLTVLGSLLLRHRLRRRVYRLRVRGRGLQRVLLVGRADAVLGLLEQLDREPEHGLAPVGVCIPFDQPPAFSELLGRPVVGDVRRVLEAVEACRPEAVAVVSHPDLSGHALRRLSWALEERGVELIVSPGIIEVAGPRLSIRPVAGLSLLHLERPGTGGRLLGKAAFDLLGALALLLVLTPLMLGIALAVRLTSRGPALFRQVRVGVEGRRFTMLKFRSMVADAEQRRELLIDSSDGNEVLFKMRRDPRVTRVGRVLRRLSLDELPQLLNVVRGEMSLVGPRPPLPEEVAEYSDDAARRLKVRPGVTGLWQVSGRSDLSWEESLRLDLRYADNWSLILDLQILWRTVRAVARGAGAY